MLWFFWRDSRALRLELDLLKPRNWWRQFLELTQADKSLRELVGILEVKRKDLNLVAKEVFLAWLVCQCTD